MENLYLLLGIENIASPDEIKAAYRVKMKRLHPDNNGGDRSPEFDAVQLAYDTLMNSERRRAYDETGFIGTMSAEAIQDQAMLFLVGCLQMLVEDDSIDLQYQDACGMMAKIVDKIIGDTEAHLATGREKLKRTETVAEKFEALSGENKIRKVVQHNARQLRTILNNIENELISKRMAREILKLYKYNFDQIHQIGFFGLQNSVNQQLGFEPKPGEHGYYRQGKG